MRESRRNNRTYRRHALKCLGDFAELRTSVDMFPQVYSIVEPVAQEALSDDSDMDIDSSSLEGASSKTMSAPFSFLLLCLFLCLFPPLASSTRQQNSRGWGGLRPKKLTCREAEGSKRWPTRSVRY